MVQTSNKSSRQTYISNESSRLELIKQRQRKKHIKNLIEFFKPDIRILGEDYIGKPFTGDDLPPKVVYTTRAHGWSTTKMKDMIAMQTIKQNPKCIEDAKYFERKMELD